VFFGTSLALPAPAQKLTPHSQDFQPAAGFRVPFGNEWVACLDSSERGIENLKMGLLNFLGENE
jgi:hypothetical protein